MLLDLFFFYLAWLRRRSPVPAFRAKREDGPREDGDEEDPQRRVAPGELAVLCGVDLGLLVFDDGGAGKLFDYCSPSTRSVLRPFRHALVETSEILHYGFDDHADY